MMWIGRLAASATVPPLALAAVTLTGPSAPVPLVHIDEPPPAVVLDVAPTTEELNALVAADDFTEITSGIFGTLGAALTAVTTAAATVPAGEPGLAGLARHVPPSCTGTGTDGNRVQVMYAVEKGQPDRYSEVLTAIRSWVADVDDTIAVSAQKTGGNLRVRWVHKNCVPVVTHVVLPAGGLGSFSSTITALRKLGYTDQARKYLVFADATRLCGVAQLYKDSAVSDNANDGKYAMYGRVDSPCWTFKANWHSVPAHETIHMLGGVQDTAAHSTASGHCNDDADVMCYDDGGPNSRIGTVCASEEGLLDCRNDDYFSARPASGSYLDRNWNSADSSFLDRVDSAPAGPRTAIKGAESVRPGLSTVYKAAPVGEGVSYRWTASPASCLPGGRAAATVTLACPSWRTGTVTLTLAASRPGSATAVTTRKIRLATGPLATLASSVKAKRTTLERGDDTTLRVQLTYGKAPVRGSVALLSRTGSGTWKEVVKAKDTGVDGAQTWTVRPDVTKEFAVRITHRNGTGWRAPSRPTATVRVVAAG
jgi:hypothetical protein